MGRGLVTKKYLLKRFDAGSYIGNGTSVTVELGFRPRCVQIMTEDGKIQIRKRDGKPSVGFGQVANNSITMRAFKIKNGDGITILDNGFSVDSNPVLNTEGQEYLWEVH